MSAPAPIDRQLRNVALLVAGCFFMEYLDGTIVTIAAPRIGSSLHVRPTAVGVVITAYLVTLAVLIPASGWLTARYGARPVFLCAIAVFTLASLGCAASASLGMLVALRVLQGVGGAMMVPVGRLTVLSSTPKSQLIRIISFLSWPGLAAPVIAPLAGGLITTYASWRWIFLINVPLGAVALTAAWRLIRSLPGPPPPPLDRLGVLLTCSGLAGLTYTADLVAESTTPWVEAAVLGAASAVALTAALRHLRRSPAPLVNLRTLRIPTFGAAIGGSSFFWLVVSGVPFLLTLLFETVFDWTPVKAGAVVLFLFAGNVGIKFVTTRLLNRFGFRQVLVAATCGLLATLVASAFLVASTPIPLIAVVVLIGGAWRSIGLTCYIAMAFSDVPPELMRDANTLQATNQQLSAGLGIAVAAVLLRIGGPLGNLLPGHAGPHTEFTIAFVLLALMTLIPLGWALRLHPTAGDAVRHGPAERPATAG